MNEGEKRIIFILGIMPRSGTHFLGNLLCQHPDCEKSVIPEDNLLARSHLLTQYINQVNRIWEIDGDLPDINPKQLLLEGIGKGLITFLEDSKTAVLKKKESSTPNQQTVKYLVTKTPQVVNLENFFHLFPKEKLLIIIRDGRALTESIQVSFKYNFEAAIRDWKTAARTILKFNEKKTNNHLIIKYENLHANTEKEILNILEFLELDASKYDIQQALNLPVVGSSVFKRGDGRVHWTPVQKTEAFQPLKRAANWTRKQHERFNWLAKDELLQLGYEPLVYTDGRLRWIIWNKTQDALFIAKLWRKRFKKLFKLTLRVFKIYLGIK